MLTESDYRALADLRLCIRQFLCEGNAAALEAGLEPQQYLLMLAIRGKPKGAEMTVHDLAKRLALKHNSTVELIDRLEKNGYVRRRRSRRDSRCVVVSLLPVGRRLVEKVARKRISELREGGTALVRAIDAVLGRKKPSGRTQITAKTPATSRSHPNF